MAPLASFWATSTEHGRTMTKIEEDIRKSGGLLTKAGVARECDVTHEAVRYWIDRGVLPAPVGTVDGTKPVWLVADIRAWKATR